MKNILHIGIDIGSTTVKIAVLNDAKQCLHACYVRHYTDIRQKVWDLLQNAYEIFGDQQITIAITGSGGIALADYLGIAFVQEVIAGTKAVRTYYPQSDVIIELGGEDAKITYLTGGNEHRMNGNCAGGTGAFIDQMATLLHTDASGLNALAEKSDTLYPIAARCGVFAKTDIQALLNEGASKENVAASVFQSIVFQTITGLACGRPIKGTVCFLGGPLTYLPQLRRQFAKTLHLDDDHVVAPENAQVYVAIGAALGSFDETPVSFMNLMGQLKNVDESSLAKSDRIDPLFDSEEELREFQQRHSQHTVPYGDLAAYSGPCYLGLDAGSTTIKAVLLSEDLKILYTHYQNNEGSPLMAAKKIIEEVYSRLPDGAFIAKTGITGYGEALLKEALHLDIGEVETIAHYQAAAHFCPDVDFILDIGGQDMKCSRLKDGHIEDILLNEACSSGCGSFLDTFAKSLNLSIEEFSKAALMAKSPIDLGSRCTVFMNSKVKQAQKEGATLADISAGLSYSVIKNALYKVIKVKDPEKLGKYIVVQGGTFYNDAVLRAFEKLLGRQVIRPAIAGLMGAFGMGLICRSSYHSDHAKTTLLNRQDLAGLSVATSIRHCGLCTNNCLLTVNTFNDGRSFITGNRCERGAAGSTTARKKALPNMYKVKYNLLFNQYKPLEQGPRGTVGIPRVLNMYEDYPFWFTFFTKLGYTVVLSDPSSKELFEKAMDTVPSDSACYPAKLVHGHIENLLEKGVDRIFYPCIQNGPQEGSRDNSFNCPMVMSYPEVIRHNMVERLSDTNTLYLCPFLPLHDKKRIVPRLQEELRVWNIGKKEIKEAALAAWDEEEAYKQKYRDLTKATLERLAKDGDRAIVLCGRPYHIDPEINHGIPEMIQSYHLPILSEDAVYHLPVKGARLSIVNQWSYHARLYHAAQVACEHPNLTLIQFSSFGCGLDAITTGQVRDILEAHQRIYTMIKLDEVSNLGAARIRLRSLMAALARRKPVVYHDVPVIERPHFTAECKKTHTILAPQMAPIHFELIKSVMRDYGYNLVVPEMPDKAAIDLGLRYVNNDMCYPSIVVIGQLLAALKSGKYDPDHTSIAMFQTCGACRATNYMSVLRQALRYAGFGQVPVFAVHGLPEETDAFHLTRQMLISAVKAAIFGDILQNVRNRMLPYERQKGETQRLFDKWMARCKEILKDGGYFRYQRAVKQMIKEFDHIPIDEHLWKPKVGIVGEILAKYHPVANNHIERELLQEGAEVVMPDFVDFFLYSAYDPIVKHQLLDGSKKASFFGRMFINIINFYRAPMRKAMKASRHFRAPHKIDETARLAERHVSLGNMAGEGWFLTGEMVKLIDEGVPNVVCLQPFGCLPNHITGKGVMHELRTSYKGANITAIDCDAGSSEVNQLNRLKLMLAVAKERGPQGDFVTYEPEAAAGRR